MSAAALPDDHEDLQLADYIRDEVCCPRPQGCEVNGAAECPAERVRATVTRLISCRTAYQNTIDGMTNTIDGLEFLNAKLVKERDEALAHD